MPKFLENIQLGFVACRIGLRRCWQWMKCYHPVVILREEYRVLCLGLSGAGKSTVLATLVGEKTVDIKPTTGFNIKTLPLKDTILDIKELGGGENVIKFWSKYFENQHGLMFVINSACSDEQLKQSVEQLQLVLSDKLLKGLPCMILATHKGTLAGRSQEELEPIFRKLMHNRKWRLCICGLHDRTAIVKCIEDLIVLMTGLE